MSLDSQHYVVGFGAASGDQVPHVKVAPGTPVRVSVSFDPPNAAHLGDVGLTVNSYPSGIDRGHPSGKYALLVHEPGRLAPGQQVRATWAARTLYASRALDLTVAFTVDDDGVSGVLAHLVID